jgi:hypothetical protein
MLASGSVPNTLSSPRLTGLSSIRRPYSLFANCEYADKTLFGKPVADA